MTKYERLLDEADNEGLYVIEHAKFKSESNGLINGDVIGLNRKIETNVKRGCILAEEIGHYYTGVGNILDQQDAGNRKQERRGRIWSYDKMIGLSGIVSAYERHCANLYEMAEYLDVTEEMLQAALDYYAQKYADGASYGQYVIQFVPTLRVAKIY